MLQSSFKHRLSNTILHSAELCLVSLLELCRSTWAKHGTGIHIIACHCFRHQHEHHKMSQSQKLPVVSIIVTQVMFDADNACSRTLSAPTIHCKCLSKCLLFLHILKRFASYFNGSDWDRKKARLKSGGTFSSHVAEGTKCPAKPSKLSLFLPRWVSLSFVLTFLSLPPWIPKSWRQFVRGKMTHREPPRYCHRTRRRK